MEQWMGLGRRRWFISDNAKTTDHPTLADTETGRSKRKELQYDTQNREAHHWGLPRVFNRVFKAARVKISKKTGKRMEEGMYTTILCVRCRGGIRTVHKNEAKEHGTG